MDLAKQKKEDNKFLFCLGVLAALLYISYAPRGLLKENNAIPVVAYAVYAVILLLFFKAILTKACITVNKTLRYLMVFLSVFAYSCFLPAERFGGTDVYQMILLCVCLTAVLYEKCVWMIVPISMLAVSIASEYLFLYGNIVIVLVFYKFFTKEGAGRLTYLFLGILTVAADTGMLFIRGEHMFIEVQPFYNFRRLGVFIICFIPYIMMACSFLKGLIQNTKQKICYWMLCMGNLTVLPFLLLKNQGGRCTFVVLLYYAVMVVMLLAMGNRTAIEQMQILEKKLRQNKPISVFVLAYPILFVPLNDAVICRTVDTMVRLMRL